MIIYLSSGTNNVVRHFPAPRKPPQGKRPHLQRMIELFVRANPFTLEHSRLGFTDRDIAERFNCTHHYVRFVKGKLRKRGVIAMKVRA